MISTPRSSPGSAPSSTRVLALKAADPKGVIVTACSTLEDTYRYFVNRGMPNCSAGLRFLVVQRRTGAPAVLDALLDVRRPAELVPTSPPKHVRRVLRCRSAPTSTRASPELVREYVGDFFSFKQTPKVTAVPPPADAPRPRVGAGPCYNGRVRSWRGEERMPFVDENGRRPSK